ncbi:MAG: hypothetical protein ABSC65_14605 [Acidobacteriaceae bacterium]|jgi:hypothetical protein
MNIRKVAAVGVILLVNRFTLADASYQETSQITGGTMVNSLKSVSFLGGKAMKDMFAPTTTTTMVHGNQKAVISKDSTEITDLDKETITHIDNVRKTYSVVTFGQMRQAFENMPKQMAQAQQQAKQEQAQQQQPPKTDLKTSFDVTVKNTGVTKVINGLTAQEQVVTMQMHVTDPNAPPTEAVNSMTYVVTTDAWISPDPPEVKELQDFDKRFAQKLMAGVDFSAWKAQMTHQNPAMMQMFSGKPGSEEAMAQMGKEMAKLQGTRVMEVTSMGGSGTGPGVVQTSAQSAPPATSGNSVAGQVATDTATQTAAGEASRLGVFGNALGSSALGAFHRKKAATPPPAAAPAATSTDAASTGTQTTSGATLMEMTVQKQNFSQEAIASSAFQVPAGFTKVESPTYGAAAK